MGLPCDSAYGLRAARVLVLSAVLAGCGHMLDLAAEPAEEGGYFVAQVSAEHPGAVALTTGRNVPGLRRMLTRMLTGNPNVNPGFVHGPDALHDLSAWSADRALPRSVDAARTVSSAMLGLGQDLHVADGAGGMSPGSRVVLIDGEPASVGLWHSTLDSLLARVMRDGVVSLSGATTTLGLADGSVLEVRYRGSMVARYAMVPARLERVEASPSPGEMLTDGYFYSVSPAVEVVAMPVAPGFDAPKAPLTTDGPSAGLAYLLSYLNAHTSGGLFGDSVVAASGVLERDGSVGSVGGFPTKEMSAVSSGARFLFVPEGTARPFRPSRTLVVVEVSHAREAVDFLCAEAASEEVAQGPLCSAGG